MKRLICRDCGAELRNTEIALNLKLRGRAVGNFFCTDCLSLYTGGTAEELNRMADYFTENNCELFQRDYVGH